MKNLKVAQKLLLGFGAVILLTAILAATSLFSTTSIDTKYTHLIDYGSNRLTLTLEAKAQMLTVRRAASHMGVYAGLESAETNINEQLTVASTGIADAKKSLDQFISLTQTDETLTASEKSQRVDLANKIETNATKYYDEIVKPLATACIAGEREKALSITEAGATISNDVYGTLDQVVDLETKANDQANAAATNYADRITMILILLTIVVILASIAFAVIIPKGITHPLAILTAFMQRAGNTGDLIPKPEDIELIGKYSSQTDEIGYCIAATDNFMQHLTHISESLRFVSEGDLTFTDRVLSEQDTMGVSLRLVREKLNDMFYSINSASEQVSIGARQIAEGSQYLAQGATEQAASVEQLSSSIDELAQKTKQNASVASRAEQLADTIIQSAERGNQQMDEMMTAVKEINDASQSISKIIKTIDDIAFQTNILALNAAVEAARAGQHGKGFAVVADEVRNLAAKSAEAAKETGNMIQNSKEKAELGARIAEDTATSLLEIVSGINESSQIIAEIASSSEEQSVGIEQINIGMEQVSQVIQQNSATAEESAASSQEMSGLSDMLQKLITQFKLDENRRS